MAGKINPDVVRGRSGGARARGLSPLVLAMASASSLAAPTVQLGPDTTLDYSLTLSYTASSRTEKAAREFLDDLNNDDGTRNFKRGSLITNRANALAEVRLKHDNVGALIRGSTFYDWAYRSDNDNNSPDTVNKTGSHDEFTRRTGRLSGQSSRLLDAFAYGNWTLGTEQYLSVKAGRHVLAWGESLFWPNISQGQSPLDATKFNVPGTEAKEGYLPVGQLSTSLTVSPWLTLTGYYQYKWEPTQLNPVGDYFGSDYFGPGAQFFRLAPGVISALPDHTFRVANFAGEIKPDDSGQWGLGSRFRLGDTTELGLYHYRYHDRVGAMFFDFTGATQYSSFRRFGQKASPASAPYYKLAYFDDIALTGASLSTKFGDAVQVGAELSYRDGAPVYLDNGAPARGQLTQGNLNFLYILGPSKIAHQTTLMGEVVHQRIEGVDKLTVSGGLPGQNGTFKDFTYDTQTKSTTLLGVGALFDYPNLFDGWDLTTKVIWTQNVDGSSMSGMGKDDRRITLGADFKRLGNFTVGLTYVGYLGSPDIKNGRTATDRDYVSLAAKYTF